MAVVRLTCHQGNHVTAVFAVYQQDQIAYLEFVLISLSFVQIYGLPWFEIELSWQILYALNHQRWTGARLT